MVTHSEYPGAAGLVGCSGKVGRRLLGDKCGKVTRRMNESENLHGAISHPVDQSISPDEKFANGNFVDFWYDAAPIRQMRERTSSVASLSNQTCGVSRRILSDVVGSGLKIQPGRIGPDYSPSHFAIRRSTSS